MASSPLGWNKSFDIWLSIGTICFLFKAAYSCTIMAIAWRRQIAPLPIMIVDSLLDD